MCWLINIVTKSSSQCTEHTWKESTYSFCAVGERTNTPCSRAKPMDSEIHAATSQLEYCHVCNAIKEAGDEYQRVVANAEQNYNAAVEASYDIIRPRQPPRAIPMTKIDIIVAIANITAMMSIEKVAVQEKEGTDSGTADDAGYGVDVFLAITSNVLLQRW
ncbi:hypothetical protein B0O99DRAFT_673086 [Bisporella sp. PMI_857]|nr:hypothetical protein B0O99DRAFT_673086 [Bisporella sp. PMI_857]